MYAISHHKTGGSVMHKQTTRKTGRGIIKNDIAKLKAILALTAKDVRGQATNALSDSYQTVKDTVVDRTTDLHENVSDYVGSKPYKAMALASFLGLACGLVMRRKRHIKKSRH